MNSVSSCCCNPADQFSTTRGNWAYQSAQIAKAVIAGEQSTDIEIQTADGDKVTLSSDVKFESSAVAYEELGRTRASYSESRGQIISANAYSKLELTVEGTLDEQEKKDIKKVLMNLYKMVKDFIAGKADTEKAQNFADLTTISMVKAEFDIKARVTVAAQSSANYIAQSPVEEKPSIQKVQTGHLPAVSKRVDKLTDRMIEVVKDSGVEPSKILNRMNRRLSRLSRRFMNEGPARWHRMRLRQDILKDFTRKLEILSAENAAGINTEQADVEKAVNLNAPTAMEMTSSATETILNAASQDFHFEMEYSVADSTRHGGI
jgi:hypothetical protein